MRNLFSTFIAPSLLLGSALFPVVTWSMDALDDTQLASATGQSGITAQFLPRTEGGIPVLRIGNITVIDKDGISGGAYTGAGYLGLNPNGIMFQSSASTASTPAWSGGAPIHVTIDTTGGGAAGATTGVNPATYINLKTPNVSFISVFFQPDANNNGQMLNLSGALSTALPTPNIFPILSVSNSANYQQLRIALANPLDVMLALGSVAGAGYSSMIKFNSLNISKIDFNGAALNLESANTATGAFSAASSRLSFVPTITNLNLTGATVDLLTTSQFQSVYPSATTGGLLVQNISNLNNVGLVLADVTAGSIGAVSTDVSQMPSGTAFAAGIQNAPMGTIGVTGMSVTGLKIGVSGM